MTADPDAAMRRLSWRIVLALMLMVAAGFRHHLVWGESERWPWLLPLLNAGEAGCLVGFVVLAGSAWWRGMALAERGRVPLGRLLRLSAPILIAAILVPCFLSADPVDYVLRGRILSLHGANPYLQVAADFPDDPFLAFGDAGWKDMPLPYGPIVANVQGAIAWLAHLLPVSPRVELIVALVLFKLLFAVVLVACAVLLHGLAKKLRPGSEGRVFVAVLWNPLMLEACIANAHNEPLVLLCTAVAVTAAIASQFGMATFALGVGAMTKIIPVLLAPFWLVLAVRERRVVPMLIGVAATVVLALGFYWQFFRDEAAFSAWQRQSELQGGSLWWAVHRATAIDLTWLVRIGRIGIVAWVGWCAMRLWRRPEPNELVFATASSLLALAVFGAPLFGAWYHVWWAPFALLLGHGYLYRVACIASVTGPLAFLVWAGWRRFDDSSQWWGVTVAVFVPLLGALRGPRERVAVS